jgi:hypothetical protein
VYASKRQLVLINDDPSLPILGVPTDARSSANLLSTALALEAVALTLPPLPDLTFEQIAELRALTRDDIKSFRRAMLRLSKELNVALLSDSPLQDVHRHARFLIETTVLPELEEIKELLARPGQPWHRRAMNVAKTVPELVGNFATLPIPMAIAKLLASIGSILADVRDEQLTASGVAKRGGIHFLLRLQNFRD